MFYLVRFSHEFMYSVVEGKSIEEMNPKPRDKVHIKDSNGTWKGIVYLICILCPELVTPTFRVRTPL